MRQKNASWQTRAVLGLLLSRPEEWRYGYELSEETGLTSGTLYPMLTRLHEQKLLDSQWRAAERPGWPPRHAYRLTRTGMALAREVGTAIFLVTALSGRDPGKLSTSP
jgi:PadR family transcriptional regulator PadR